MANLESYQKYSREDVFKILKIERPFDQIWKEWGIINLGKYKEGMEGDFIFFVTIGSLVDGREWDEGITDNGIVSWQSQNQNSFSSPNIIKLIQHDDQLNNIYYFYRQSADDLYKYLGKLKYLNHDQERERPVYFQWQIINWDINQNSDINLIQVASERIKKAYLTNVLTQKQPPKTIKREGVSTTQFRARKDIDYSAIDRRNKRLGLKGEILVLQYEQIYLLQKNREDLSKKVSHDSVVIGDGLGYDILSYDENGVKKYIEVKTTSGSSKTDFFITKCELNRSKIESNYYYLYRVYNYNLDSDSGDYYIKKGALDDNFNLEPDNYRAKI